MTRPEVISIVALLVSVTTLVFWIYFNLRDRANIKSTSRFHAASELGSASVNFTIVNAGRRPIILRMWGGTDEKGEWVGTFLGEGKSGLRLGEHERFDYGLARSDLFMQTPDDEIVMANLWVEDTLGRRYEIKGAKKNLALLLNS